MLLPVNEKPILLPANSQRSFLAVSFIVHQRQFLMSCSYFFDINAWIHYTPGAKK